MICTCHSVVMQETDPEAVGAATPTYHSVVIQPPDQAVKSQQNPYEEAYGSRFVKNPAPTLQLHVLLRSVSQGSCCYQ